jgi:hypothetical protein
MPMIGFSGCRWNTRIRIASRGLCLKGRVVDVPIDNLDVPIVVVLLASNNSDHLQLPDSSASCMEVREDRTDMETKDGAATEPSRLLTAKSPRRQSLDEFGALGAMPNTPSLGVDNAERGSSLT